MKRILLSSLFVFAMISSAVADEMISFVASAPKTVEVGTQFRIEFKVNSWTDGLPALPEIDGLEILYGPSTSRASSTQTINGRKTSSESTTFTYIVKLHKEGDITIPATSVIVKGKQYTSNPLTIKVLPVGQPLPSAQQNTNSDRITDERIFIKAEVNKKTVYDQEALELTYKLYVDNLDFREMSTPDPKLKGFNIQKVELPNGLRFNREHYNGHNYYMAVFGKYILFPQETGKLEIPAVECEAILLVENDINLDLFTMMLNDIPSYIPVKKKLKTKNIAIEVKKLPADKPKDFSGAVGQFAINSTVSTNKLKSNEYVNFKVTVKGDGNMKLMGDPIVDLPSEFDVETPIITNNFGLTNNGFLGERVYEYIMTPRTAGTYTIPAVKFVYFDTKTGKYKTIESKEHLINVEKGVATTVGGNGYVPMKEDGKVIATDIRHIKLGDDKRADSTFFASTTYCLLYVIPLAAFVLFVVVYRKRIKMNSNVALVKTKKANSVAVRRLKNAKALLRDDSKNEFYDEILKAVWGYMSDKLNMPLSQLSKENISSELSRRGCDDLFVDELMSLLNEGEFARYAPGDAGATMDKVYKMALDVIGKMENTIKK